jgi:shikimate kinase
MAQRCDRRFLDTDILIELEAGMTIPALFAERGEPYFRALEHAIVCRVSEGRNLVVATGGGVMTNEANVQKLKASGTLICLTATPETIFSRVRGTADRPLLQGENPLAKIRALLAARAEAYAKADLMVDTSHLSTDDVVEAILTRLKTTARL